MLLCNINKFMIGEFVVRVPPYAVVPIIICIRYKVMLE